MRQALKIVLRALAILLVSRLAAQTAECPDQEAQAELPAPLPAGDLALGEPVAGVGRTRRSLRRRGIDRLGAALRAHRHRQRSLPALPASVGRERQQRGRDQRLPLPQGEEAEAGVTIITPLETLLTEQIVMRVDEAQPERYPFTFCAAVGCVARIGFFPTR